MVTGLSPEKIVREIGHDGMAVEFPDLLPPFCYRSIHPHEITHALYGCGHIFTEFHFEYVLRVDDDHAVKYKNDMPNERWLDTTGVLLGVAMSGQRHAVAWDGRQILDPNGLSYDRNLFHPKVYYEYLPRRAR